MHDSTESKGSARSSLVIMICTLLSRLLGIVKARVLGSVFGAGAVADVINFTFNIPNNFRKLFAEGAVNSALIPAFSSLIALDDKKRSLRLFSLLCTYQTLLLIPLVVVSYVFAEPLIRFLSDFDSQQIELGAKLLPFFMVYLATISLAATFNGVLQSHANFLHAYLSPLLFSLAVIFGVTYLSDSLGPMSMAYSVLGGGLLQGSYSYLMVRRYGYRLHVALRTTDTPFKPVVKAWSLVTLGMGVQIVTQLVSFLFASSLEKGSVTAFSNATIFYQTPYGIFFNAISAVSLPLMSRAYVLKHTEKLNHYTRSSLVNLTALLLPSTIILFFLSNESVSVVLQTGRFTLADANLTAFVLRPYLLFMLTSAWYGMYLRLGYSANRHSLMTKITLVQNLLDIALMYLFISMGWGIISLPIANGLSYLVGLLIACIVLRDLYRIHSDRLLFKELLRILLANLPVLAAGLLYASFAPTWHHQGSTLASFLLLALFGLAGCTLVLISYQVAHIPLLELLRSKKQQRNL
ncbi:MAG: murein biosynthesis integral membrane protein MurJ [Spirochaetia bacterium]|nr:murein biosynthesis integral membrane protein MurJ [Spirochaetia bacterium]